MGARCINMAHDEVEFVSRGEWGARPPIATQHLQLPIDIVVIHFTNTKPCLSREECVNAVQELQRVHMDEKNLIDIKYNFIVGGDCAVYEGRGWHVLGVKVPISHEHLSNDMSPLDIAFIGSVEDVESSPKMIKAADDFIKASRLKRCIRVEVLYVFMEGGDRAWRDYKREKRLKERAKQSKNVLQAK